MQYSWNAICNNGDRIFKGYWIYNGGVIFILPPLFKTDIFSKYKCLLPGSVPASCHCLGYVDGMMRRTFL